jgi:two-component system phosphate regulon response regulator OmpR
LNQKILLVEDDVRLAQMIETYLRQSGFVVTHASTGMAALEAARADAFAAIILDLMLPDMDGLDICRQLRVRLRTPVLMLTARGDAMDKVIGLEMGADDYLAKPFEPRELLARLRAILRRSTAPSDQDVLVFGRLELDRGAREVRIDGQPRPLTSHQYEILRVLAERAGRVLSREQVLDLLKGQSLEPFDRSIDVHVSRIRAAIEDDPRKPRRLLTVRGAGYVFSRVQDDDAGRDRRR